MTEEEDFDTPWKAILEDYFQDFLAFFLPEAHHDIDWSRGYEFLDKELVRITREAEIGTRFMDRLAKVWQINGEERGILIHVDVQGEQQKKFPSRMFTYYYRAYDLKQLPVVGLAVLTDDSKNWRPVEFRQELWGCQVVYRFNMVKLLDYEDKLELLESSDNPFAIVTLAHLQAKKTHNQPASRFDAKWQIIRSLYRRGFARQKIIDLFRFVDWVLALPLDDDQRFWQQLSHFEEETKMPYLCSVERIGIEKGRLEGMAEMLMELLQERFGSVPDYFTEKLAHADLATLKTWSRKIVGAERIEQVFQ
ncbi:MAG: cytosolic protein [Magnetococcales bacterium]|nr:cytosolic protein [Magnetococcales bacterium]NGZ25689.1 cytosolic protein [Magnetococcales bacterium]